MTRTMLLGVLLILPPVLAVIPSATAKPLADAPSDLRALVEAEWGFNRASADSGMKAAFLAHLAPDGVIFRPGPVNGREWMASWPGTEGILSWTPMHAEISGGGDFGFTTGPWEYRATADADPIQTGYYLSVWQRTGDGWRVLGDIGTVHEALDSVAVGEITWPVRREPAPAVSGDFDPEAERDRLLEEDARLSSEVFENGVERFVERTTEDVLLFRLQEPVRRGREAARVELEKMLDYPAWVPVGGAVAGSGDLAFTYGTIHPPEHALGKSTLAVGSYLRVWRRDAAGAWLVAAEVLIPSSRG